MFIYEDLFPLDECYYSIFVNTLTYKFIQYYASLLLFNLFNVYTCLITKNAIYMIAFIHKYNWVHSRLLNNCIQLICENKHRTTMLSLAKIRCTYCIRDCSQTQWSLLKFRTSCSTKLVILNVYYIPTVVYLICVSRISITGSASRLKQHLFLTFFSYCCT